MAISCLHDPSACALEALTISVMLFQLLACFQCILLATRRTRASRSWAPSLAQLLSLGGVVMASWAGQAVRLEGSHARCCPPLASLQVCEHSDGHVHAAVSIISPAFHLLQQMGCNPVPRAGCCGSDYS
jgi:hypothetical protein